MRKLLALLLVAVATLAIPAHAPASLQVPSYAAPQFAAPVANAYAWISGLAIDFSTGQGTITVNVHPDATSADAGKPPIDQVQVQLGQVLVPANGNTPAVTFPTLTQLVQQAAAQQAANPGLDPFGALRAAIYAQLPNHPKLAGATQVP